MERSPLGLTSFVLVCAWFLLFNAARADLPHFWRIASPAHEQTFAYGSEQRRVWAERGRDHHLVVLINFTNDPYVSQNFPRQYDNFEFAFPGITLDKDGRTFSYRAPSGSRVPVATKQPDFLGINEITLLPDASLVIEKPHGYLSLFIDVGN